MMLNVIFVLLSVTVSFIETKPKAIAPKLRCYYSRYMLNYFTLNEYCFANVFEGKPTVNIEEMCQYGVNLQSHGSIVLYMLDQLSWYDNNIFPTELLRVNFYLNNSYGTVNIGILNTRTIHHFDEGLYLKNGYKYFHQQIKDGLLNFIHGNCNRDTNSSLIRDADQSDPILCEINALLSAPSEDNFKDMEHVLSKLYTNKHVLDRIFKSTKRRQTFFKFHPSVMLFSGLMTGDKTNQVSSAPTVNITNNDDDDKLNLLRNVVTYWKNSNGVNMNISDLYELIKTIIEPAYVRSYQQQVLAATLHPVLMCVTTFLHIFDKLIKVFYPGGKPENLKKVDIIYKAYENKLNPLGEILLESLKHIIGINLFPSQVQRYLAELCDSLTIFMHYSEKRYMNVTSSNWIPSLLDSCTEPMKLNELQFYNPIETFNLIKDENIQQLINKFSTEINDITQYVIALDKHKEEFHVVIGTINHDNMFQIKPLDLLNNPWVTSNILFIKK